VVMNIRRMILVSKSVEAATGIMIIEGNWLNCQIKFNKQFTYSQWPH
jgi:hypothetical protein